MANIRLKVSVDKLIERIEAKKAEEERAHERALTTYRKKRGPYIEAVARALDVALNAAMADDAVLPHQGNAHINGRYRRVLHVPIAHDEVVEPTLNTKQYDKDINWLKLSANPEITLSVEDRLARYL